MLFALDWRIEATKILVGREITAVLPDLHRKAPRSHNTRLNLAVFRLAYGRAAAATRCLEAHRNK
jgi:hypothetical protein